MSTRVNFHQGDCENLDFMTRIQNQLMLCHAATFAHEGLSNAHQL